MTARISAFETAVELAGPEPSLQATFAGMHFNMGHTPTTGRWTLSNGMVLDHCGSSGIFSEDGRWFAAPLWIREYQYHKQFKRLMPFPFGQRVAVVELASRETYVLTVQYGIVELETFRNGLLSGTDTSDAGPRPLIVRVSPE